MNLLTTFFFKLTKIALSDRVSFLHFDPKRPLSCRESVNVSINLLSEL